ncbi:MAG: tetratricopeptide repeat protein [Candidatus Zhuqueibacterota bacterium]
MKIKFTIKVVVIFGLISILLNTCASRNEHICKDGKLLYQQGNFEGAIAAFDSYIAANPNFKKGFLNWNPSYERALAAKGNAQFQLRQFEDAVMSYDQSIAVAGTNANNEANYFNRGLALFLMNRNDEARDSFDRVDNKKFDNPTTLLLKADIFAAASELDTAQFLIGKCLEHDPRNGDALIRKVNLWIQSAQPDSARALFQQIIGMNEPGTFSLFTRTIGIMDSYFAPMAVENDSVHFYTTAAEEFIHAGDYGQAAAALTSALNFTQKPAAILLMSGDVLMALGETGKAVERYDAALAIESHRIEAMWKKANALLVRGDKDAARSLFEQVLRTQPENVFASVAMRLYFAD